MVCHLWYTKSSSYITSNPHNIINMLNRYQLHLINGETEALNSYMTCSGSGS